MSCFLFLGCVRLVAFVCYDVLCVCCGLVGVFDVCVLVAVCVFGLCWFSCLFALGLCPVVVCRLFVYDCVHLMLSCVVCIVVLLCVIKPVVGYRVFVVFVIVVCLCVLRVHFQSKT